MSECTLLRDQVHRLETRLSETSSLQVGVQGGSMLLANLCSPIMIFYLLVTTASSLRDAMDPLLMNSRNLITHDTQQSPSFREEHINMMDKIGTLTAQLHQASQQRDDLATQMEALRSVGLLALATSLLLWLLAVLLQHASL